MTSATGEPQVGQPSDDTSATPAQPAENSGEPTTLAHPERGGEETHALAAPVGGEGIVLPGDELIVLANAEAEPADENAPPVSPARANAVLVALALGAFLVVSNEVAPMGLLKPMSEDLGISEARLGLTGTAFAVSVMLTTLPLAMLTTRMVRRWVIVAALGLFTIGAFVGAIAPSFEILLLSRGLTGASHALFWAVVTPAAAGMFPLKRRGKSVARLLLGASAAGVIGLPAETYLAQRIHWHAPFWVLSAGGLLLAITIAILMPSFRTSQATVVRGEIPSGRRFVRIMAITLLMTAGMSLTWSFFSPFVTDVGGFADASVPWLMVTGGTVGVVTTWFIARFVDRWPVRTVVVGFVGVVLLFMGMSLGGDVKPVLVVMVCLQSLSWSIIVVAMVNWALRHSPWTADIGNATYATAFNAGNAVGSATGAAVLAAHGAEWLPVVSLVLMAATLATALTVPGTKAYPAIRARLSGASATPSV